MLVTPLQPLSYLPHFFHHACASSPVSCTFHCPRSALLRLLRHLLPTHSWFRVPHRPRSCLIARSKHALLPQSGDHVSGCCCRSVEGRSLHISSPELGCCFVEAQTKSAPSMLRRQGCASSSGDRSFWSETAGQTEKAFVALSAYRRIGFAAYSDQVHILERIRTPRFVPFLT